MRSASMMTAEELTKKISDILRTKRDELDRLGRQSPVALEAIGGRMDKLTSLQNSLNQIGREIERESQKQSELKDLMRAEESKKTKLGWLWKEDNSLQIESLGKRIRQSGTKLRLLNNDVVILEREIKAEIARRRAEGAAAFRFNDKTTQLTIIAKQTDERNHDIGIIQEQIIKLEDALERLEDDPEGNLQRVRYDLMNPTEQKFFRKIIERQGTTLEDHFSGIHSGAHMEQSPTVPISITM